MKKPINNDPGFREIHLCICHQEQKILTTYHPERFPKNTKLLIETFLRNGWTFEKMNIAGEPYLPTRIFIKLYPDWFEVYTEWNDGAVETLSHQGDVTLYAGKL